MNPKIPQAPLKRLSSGIINGTAIAFFASSALLFGFVIFNTDRNHQKLPRETDETFKYKPSNTTPLSKSHEPYQPWQINFSEIFPTAATIEVHAKSLEPHVEIMDLARAPTFSAGNLNYQILGLGQHSKTTKQIVWVRSLSSNRVAGFEVNQRLFGGPVVVKEIRQTLVVMEYRGSRKDIPIKP